MVWVGVCFEEQFDNFCMSELSRNTKSCVLSFEVSTPLPDQPTIDC